MKTSIIVRAKAKDSKFIGSSMGGAFVRISDSESGRLLAEGLTAGGTGDTTRLVVTPVKRGSRLADESSAKFEAAIDIDEPTLLTIEILAPFGWKQSITRNLVQVWLIPGRDLVGDGVIVEVHGFAVDVISPRDALTIRAGGDALKVPVTANIVMM